MPAKIPHPTGGDEFRPRKKRVAIYFNNGTSSFSVHADTNGIEGPGKQKLIDAINIAKVIFLEAYRGKGD